MYKIVIILSDEVG